MMGIYIDGSAYVFGDKKSVLVNSSFPISVLRNKLSSIALNFVREGSATNEWRVSYVNTHDNAANLLTKPMSNGKKRQSLIEILLHYVF